MCSSLICLKSFHDQKSPYNYYGLQILFFTYISLSHQPSLIYVYENSSIIYCTAFLETHIFPNSNVICLRLIPGGHEPQEFLIACRALSYYSRKKGIHKFIIDVSEADLYLPEERRYIIDQLLDEINERDIFAVIMARDSQKRYESVELKAIFQEKSIMVEHFPTFAQAIKWLET